MKNWKINIFIFFIVSITCSLSAEKLRALYPEIEPNETGYIDVDSGHKIYWEQCGNPKGKPVLFLHGGPGIGTSPYNRCFFNPEKYRIILMDQRGCGKSKPFSSLVNNTTWHLVSDIETLRAHLNIEQWVVFGGSWGSTLALTYAIEHPDHVQALILRGIFLCRPKEIQWYYQKGANSLYPDLWENYIKPIPESERNDFIHAFYNRLTSDDAKVRQEAAMAWSGWEGGTSRLYFDPKLYASFTQDDAADSIARIECHYFVNNTFFDTDNWIIENIDRIRHIPGIIVQGRYDIPCPMISAWELHCAWPEANLEIISDAGHSALEPGIMDALIRATDSFTKD
ncbi:MAG: prolyl aminopeptidase [Parachlamydiales bacterium]|nr:prolyl aminopeptidase [Parachlamydiales bacterium]